MSENKLPSGIDRVVGQRVRELLNLTFQQVQKYEKGVNRISAGRLFEIASVLGVPITYFYEGAEDFVDHENAQLAEDGDEIHAPVMNSEMLELISAFQKIEDMSLRKSLLNTVRAAASAFEFKQQD